MDPQHRTLETVKLGYPEIPYGPKSIGKTGGRTIPCFLTLSPHAYSSSTIRIGYLLDPEGIYKVRESPKILSLQQFTLCGRSGPSKWAGCHAQRWAAHPQTPNTPLQGEVLVPHIFLVPTSAVPHSAHTTTQPFHFTHTKSITIIHHSISHHVHFI